MLTYSIAIRTLGTAGNRYCQELQSITQQTIQPERVLVYIAEDYDRPSFTIGREEYVWVKKGMMAQRLLPYDEITSDCILMLDDDVCLSSDSAERMLRAMEENGADCVGADTFPNQEMTIKQKMVVAITNLVIPHYSKKWAFKIHRNGSFSYNNSPKKAFYWSQSCAGPASMWKKSVYKKLHLEDELWLDTIGFAYGEDMLEFYKLHRNGYRLGILYNARIDHLDAKSGGLKTKSQWMYLRTKAQFVIWWRTCLCPGDESWGDKVIAILSYGFKTIWLFLVVCVATIIKWQSQLMSQYIIGLSDGWHYVHSKEYRRIGSYIIHPTS